jgi:N-acetylglucosamine malate deacetylase 2
LLLSFFFLPSSFFFPHAVMKQLILVGILLGITSCADTGVPTATGPKTIMAVLAHPDDESAIGQVLARYAREGHMVHLVLAADGRFGVEEHAGIPPGDSLASVRRAESMCAADILGIESPLFFDAHDTFGAIYGLDQYFSQTAMIKEKLAAAIAELKPDAIITFGPDGDTGHIDHKGIGDLVTEVLLMNDGWYESYPLYFVAWPQEKEVWIAQGGQTSLNYVDKRYRNVHIGYTQEDLDKLFASLECYRSQYTDDDVAKWIEAEKKDTTFTMYFRQFVTDTTVKTDF